MKLEAEWTTYRNRVIPTTAPSVQLVESRRAFYAGAWAFYSLLMNHLEPGANETPADMKFMEKLDSEMRAFRNKVQRGEA
jgi:hypothetical protein